MKLQLPAMPWKISRNLLILFSVSTLIIIASGILVYKSFERRTKVEAHAQLSILARVKIREVINWRKERINDATFIYNNKQLKQLFFDYLSDPADSVRKNSLIEFTMPLIVNHDQFDILIVELNGKVTSLFTGNNGFLNENRRPYFERCIKERKVVLSDVEIQKEGNTDKIQLSSFIPLFLDKGGNVFCVVEIKIDPEKNLFSSIQVASENYKTAETFLVRKEGKDSVLFINKLKYAENSRLNFMLPLLTKDLPAAMAVMGRTGIFEGRDYGGRPVLADLQRIPDSPWYIVSKVELSELYSPLRERAAIITGLVVILILFSGAVLLNIWREQQLKFLEQTMKDEREKSMLQQRIDYLIKDANDAFILSDMEGRIIQVNDRAVSVYGYSAEEFCTLTLSDIRSEQARKDIEKDKKMVEEHNGYIFETIHLKKGGIEFPVEISSRKIGISGEAFFQSTIRDITERKTHEEKLKKTINELDRLNKNLEQFTYASAHDLQEPLRMVHTYAQLLERKFSDRVDNSSREYFNYLTEGAQRMQQLIQALLKYTNIGSMNDGFVSVNLNNALEEAAGILSRSIKETGASITASHIPPVIANYSHMVLLFQNLMENSLKFRSSKPPCIEISAEQNDTECTVKFSDNGIGIEKEYFEKIFFIFQKLHEREKYPGIGFGLTLCKKIVEHHGGRIWVESEPGRGSEFFFTLPVEK